MITMTTYTVYEYLKSKFPDIADVLRNGHVDKQSNKSIGVFLGSDSRSTGKLAIGGIDCTTVRMLPISIKIRWSENQLEHDNLATRIYDELLTERSNFEVNGAKIACFSLLDDCPASLGRDEKNVCESVIRANVHYYVS